MTLRPKGRLGSEPLFSLVGTLGALGATGVLELSRKRLSRKLVLCDGRIDALVSNARDDRLLDWGVATGALALEEKAAAELLAAAGDAPLTMRALLDGGATDAAGLRELGARHLEAMVREAALWRDAEYAITPGRVDLGDEPPLGCSAVALAHRLARDEPPRGAPYSVAPLTVAVRFPVDAIRQLVPLSPAESAVLGACSRPMRRDEIRAALGSLDADDVEAAIAALWRAGLLEKCTVAAAASQAADGEVSVSRDQVEMFLAAADAQDLEALLGVKAGSDEEAIRKAYYATVRRFHPDRFRQGPFAHFHADIERAFHLVNAALAALMDPTYARKVLRRDETQEVDLDRLVRGYLASARDLVSKGQRSDAVTMLDQALKHAPDHAELRYARAAILVLNPRERESAISELTALTHEFPGRADLFAAAGLALKVAGRETEGQVMIDRGAALDSRLPLVAAARGETAAVKKISGDPILAPLVTG